MRTEQKCQRSMFICQRTEQASKRHSERALCKKALVACKGRHALRHQSWSHTSPAVHLGLSSLLAIYAQQMYIATFSLMTLASEIKVHCFFPSPGINSATQMGQHKHTIPDCVSRTANWANLLSGSALNVTLCWSDKQQQKCDATRNVMGSACPRKKDKKGNRQLQDLNLRGQSP